MRKKSTRFRQLVITYLSGVKGNLSFAVVCTLCVAAADLLRPWPLKIIFDNILLSKPLPGYLSPLGGLLHGDKTWAVVLVSFSIILITGLKSISGYSQLFITSRIGFKLAHAFRRELFNHLQRLSISFFKRAESGELITNITSDTNNLRDVFTDLTLTFVSESLSLVGMLTIMLLLNWKLSLIALATFPVLSVLSFYRYRTIRDSTRRQRKAEGKIATRLTEILNSVPVVQAFGREEYEGERFTAESVLTLEESIRTARLEAAAARAVDIVSAVGTWAVILFGSLQALEGSMTPGSVLVFASYINSLYGPVRNLAKLSAKFSKASVSAQRISEVLELEPEIQDAPDAVEVPRLRGEIVFDNVSFDYGDGRSVLRNISFHIACGERVVLLGPSGSGKSTLCGLILRFYDPQAGCISIDRGDIRRYKRESLRRQIGIVLQDSLLFGETIWENIAYGKLDATMEEIIEAAHAANAHEFIMELERGYDTVIGERGGTLSGGQRQRIAIARTFIRDVPILLLDELMTGLDAESETAVCEALERLMAGRTSLLITHDLQAAVEADTILMLEDGCIVEQGSHLELMERSRRYKELYELKHGQHEDEMAALGV